MCRCFGGGRCTEGGHGLPHVQPRPRQFRDFRRSECLVGKLEAFHQMCGFPREKRFDGYGVAFGITIYQQVVALFFEFRFGRTDFIEIQPVKIACRGIVFFHRINAIAFGEYIDVVTPSAVEQIIAAIPP